MPASSSLTPLSIVLQAMRFPPKSYNKDLESAEVSCFLLWVEGEVSGKPGWVGLGADQVSAWLVLSSLGGSDWVQTTSPRLVLSPPPPGPLPQERREREQQDLEFAKEMAEDDDDSFP